MIRRPISMPQTTRTGSSGGNPTPRMNGRSFRAAWGGNGLLLFRKSLAFPGRRMASRQGKASKGRGFRSSRSGHLFDDVPETSASDLAERQLLFAERALEGTGLPVVLCPSVYCGEFMESFPGVRNTSIHGGRTSPMAGSLSGQDPVWFPPHFLIPPGRSSSWDPSCDLG